MVLNKVNRAFVTGGSGKIGKHLVSLLLRENFDIVCNTISSTIKETLILEKSTHNIFVKSAEQQMVFNKILSFFQERLDR